jgi:hypothetical protein
MKEYEITFVGKMISLNDLYSGKHWSHRHKAKEKFRGIFDILLLEAKVKWMKEYRIDMVYNSRLDSDNTIPALKFLNDSLKKKYVPEDDPRYFKGFSINIDKRLKHDTYKIKITQLA